MLTRMFEDRYAPVRHALLILSGIAYLMALRDPGEHRNEVNWAADVLTLLLATTCVRWPFAGALAQSVNLGVASLYGVAEPVVPAVGATYAIFEVALRAGPGWRLWTVIAVASVLHIADDWRILRTETAGVVFNLVVLVGVPVLFGSNIRSARLLAAQAEERAAAEEQRRRSETRAARADERTAIARELHDVVAHHVASIVLRVGVARHVIPDPDPRTDAVLNDVHTTGTAALADLRQLVALLRDPSAPTSQAAVASVDAGTLPTALEAAVERARQTGVHVETNIDPALSTLDAVRGLAALRLVQEGLTNVARHAGPGAKARVTLVMTDGDLVCEITDDGQGVPHASVPGTGHGIIGLRERVEIIGGTLAAGPGEGGVGWRVRATLPSPRDADAPPARMEQPA